LNRPPTDRTLELGGLAFNYVPHEWRRKIVTNLIDTMDKADFVLIDGVVFETEYLRVPDEFTVADDVVLEAKRGDTEIELTRAELDDAEHVGEGVYRLKSGAHLRFLASATIH
jgi:hypothetical protein